MSDKTSFGDRIRWMRHHLQPLRRTVVISRSLPEVVSYMDAAVEHTFPSPRGEPVFAGRFVGANPVRIRVRAFPHGARVGRLYGGTQGDWMKPALVGGLEGAVGATTLTFSVSAWAGEVAALASFTAGCLAILSAVILTLMAASGSLVCLVIGLVLLLGFGTLVAQTEQGIEEERLLLDWLSDVQSSLESSS